jgi:two-component system, sensor histidine kinase and response regulator
MSGIAGPPARDPGRPLRILLAEDHPVNQKLAVRLLEKRGHSVVIAPDGEAAVEAAGRERFDLVLMDIQMPRLSGLEATSAIREREQHAGTHVPIIAMTAHTMRGDRERCLEAGMDAYLSKPLVPALLFETIHWVVAAGAEVGSAPDDLLERFDGDEDLLRELAGIFLDSTPGHLAALRIAVRDRDSRALEAAAHLLRGSVSIFGAPEACDAALRLEEMGHSGAWDRVPEALAAFEREVALVQASLGARTRGAAG